MELGRTYQMWKNKYIGSYLVVLSKNADGSLNATFELNTLETKRIHQYQQSYLNTHYDYIGPYSWTVET